MDPEQYRQRALKAALDPRNPRHLLPYVPPEAENILEVGCHAGHILEALRLPVSVRAFGCDVDPEALALARKCVPGAHFALAAAERLPYASSSLDMLYARGVVVLLDIPRALEEFSRVLRRGGKLWLSLHRWSDCLFILKGSFNQHPFKTTLFGAYALMNSGILHCAGVVFRYPFNRSRTMTFQTEWRMKRELARVGFTGVSFSRGTYFVVEATRRAT